MTMRRCSNGTWILFRGYTGSDGQLRIEVCVLPDVPEVLT